MLNLSDNELDRLSREAASQHDPGDPLGPQAWERLEVRLDKELGRAGPDASRGLRGFRRLPFQYAPVILLIVGVSYYFVKQAVRERKAENSGSPPLTVVKTPQQQPGTTASDSSLKNPVYSDKSTSTPYHQDQSQDIDQATTASGTLSGAKTAPSGVTTAPSGTGSNINPSGSVSTPSGSKTSLPGSNTAPGANALAGIATRNTHNNRTRNRSHHNPANQGLPNNKPAGQDQTVTGLEAGTGLATGSNLATGTDLATGSNRQPNRQTNLPSEPAGPEKAFIQHAHSLRSHPTISDSTLRAFTVQTPTNPGKKNSPSLNVNRSLSFGFQVAPDFSSVNALAGDKAGSSIGLTVDYQFANRLHIGTGLLFSKKNYSARAADYHVPEPFGPGSYYWSIGIPKPVDFVKGSMIMLEIPLSLRYDFSITGNTIFFASGGLSTYLFGKEDAKYFYEMFRQEVCREIQYNNKSSFFSTANLSLGVETGISNSLSIQVAPYIKLPVSDLGFGRIRMNSVGINVALRYSPVISRKRQH